MSLRLYPNQICRNKENIDKKVAKAIGVMVATRNAKKTTTHLAGPLGSEGVDFQGDGDEKEKTFNVEHHMHPHVIIQKMWALSVVVESSPLAGMPCFISCVSGTT